MTGEQFEAAWRLAREPVAAVVVGVWAVVGVVVAVFIVRFRNDWRKGMHAGVPLALASVALGCFIGWARHDPTFRYVEADVLVNGEGVPGRRLKVHGDVTCGSARYPAGTYEYRFAIQRLSSGSDPTLEVRSPTVCSEGR